MTTGQRIDWELNSEMALRFRWAWQSDLTMLAMMGQWIEWALNSEMEQRIDWEPNSETGLHCSWAWR